MSEKPDNADPRSGEFAMPEPEFRSTQGTTPKKRGLQDDIPTEPGFGEERSEPTISIEGDDADKAPQAVRATTKTRVRHHKKKTGCAKIFGIVAGLIGLSVAAIVVVLVYFLFFYRAASTQF